MLSDTDILRAVSNGDISILPCFKQRHLRPVGLRLHLDNSLLIPRAVPGTVVDFTGSSDDLFDRYTLTDAAYILVPGAFILGATIESIKTCADIVCLLDGRTTMARIGLSIHNAACTLDGTHAGYLKPVLELSNHGPFSIRLCHGIAIGMACFDRLNAPVSCSSTSSAYFPQTTLCPPLFSDSAAIDAFTDDMELSHTHTLNQP